MGGDHVPACADRDGAVAPSTGASGAVVKDC